MYDTTDSRAQSSSVSPWRCCSVDRRPSSLGSHRRLLSASNGYMYPSEFSLSWRSSSTELFTARYLFDLLRRVADMPSRNRLRSSSTGQVDVRPSCRVAVGDRSFAVTGHRIWNSFPRNITSATSLSVFRRKLKTCLFRQFYTVTAPLWLHILYIPVCVNCIVNHLNIAFLYINAFEVHICASCVNTQSCSFFYLGLLISYFII